uniref:VHS domain-containing protein n=1 Tax=Oryzias latipes TaxID=8090 RepID=A0A3P9MK64_ORYLA
MDFLIGNPFSTPVGQRIERATSGSLQAEDWGLNLEICDIINETDEGNSECAAFKTTAAGCLLKSETVLDRGRGGV